MDDRHYYVETPEVVPISYTVAGAASRCLAATVDTLLILLLQIILGVTALFLDSQNQVIAQAGSVVYAIWAILAFVLIWGYYLFFEVLWSGQTPGKRLIGLRVLREGGRPLDVSASAVRNLVRAVDLLPFAYGLGVLVMFADPRARRLGDLAAGTLVVREGLPITLADLTRGAAPVALPPRDPAAPPTPILPNLHLLTPADYALAEDFLRRRDQLGSGPRAALAADLAATLRARLGLAATGDPERFVEHVVREYRVGADGGPGAAAT